MFKLIRIRDMFVLPVVQESLLEWLQNQVYWKRNNGWDHVFVCQDPNALYKVVDRVKNGILLVSDFGRLTREQGSLVKDVILPYSHRINPYLGEIGVENRDKLLFFMGNRYRKEVIYLQFLSGVDIFYAIICLLLSSIRKEHMKP